MFWIHVAPRGVGSRGAGSVEPLREKVGGTAERDHSTPKTAGVNQIIAGRTLKAVSDSPFAATRMNAQGCGSITCSTTNSLAAKIVVHFVPNILPPPMVTVSCAGSECLLCRRLHGRSLVSQNSLSRMAK